MLSEYISRYVCYDLSRPTLLYIFIYIMIMLINKTCWYPTQIHLTYTHDILQMNLGHRLGSASWMFIWKFALLYWYMSVQVTFLFAYIFLILRIQYVLLICWCLHLLRIWWYFVSAFTAVTVSWNTRVQLSIGGTVAMLNAFGLCTQHSPILFLPRDALQHKARSCYRMSSVRPSVWRWWISLETNCVNN